MASMVSGYIGKIDPGDGTEYAIGSTAYGVCETAEAEAAKTVDMTQKSSLRFWFRKIQVPS